MEVPTSAPDGLGLLPSMQQVDGTLMEDEDRASIYLFLLLIGLIFLTLGLAKWIP